MSMFDLLGSPRTWCDCLREARAILKNQSILTYRANAVILRSLIEELQVHGNRMEAAIEYDDDIKRLIKRRAKLKAEVKALENRIPKADKKEEEEE